MINKYNKKTRDRLKKVCLALYPEYKKARVCKRLNVTMWRKTDRRNSNVPRKLKINNYSLLITYYLPTRLTMLKYNNKDFLGSVIEEVTSCEMRGDDVVLYFYTEIVKIKYPHIFKEVCLPVIARNSSTIVYEDEIEIDNIIQKTTEHINKVVKKTFLMKLRDHPLYYEIVTITAIILMLSVYIIIK